MADDQISSPAQQLQDWLDHRQQQAASPPAQTAAPAPPPSAALPAPPSDIHDPRGMLPNIVYSAKNYGIDPNVAIKVAQSEGLSSFYGDGGKSGGAFQLYTGGGYGNEFQDATGLNPLDPKNEAATIDYALKRASKEGWGAFHGAANTGIGQWDGITGAPQTAAATAPAPAPTAAPAPPPIPGTPAEQVDNWLQWRQQPTPPPAQEGAPAPGQGGGPLAGFRSGLIGLRQDTIAYHALLDYAMNDEKGQQDLMSTYDALDRQRNAIGPKYNNFGDLIEKGGVGDWLSTLSFKAGELLPNLVALLAPEVGLAGIGARLATRVAARGGMNMLEASLLTAKYAGRAAKLGAFLGASAQSTAGIAAEQYQSTGRMDPGAAFGFGLLGGIPGAITPLAMASRLGLPKSLAGDFAETIANAVAGVTGGGFLQRRLGGAIGYGLEAGVANAAQEAVNRAARAYVDQHYDALGPDAVARIGEAAATGALGGALFGAASPRHALTDEINKHLDALLKGDPNFKPGATGYTGAESEEVKKAFPDSDNPTFNEMQNARRQYITDNGGWDSVSEAARKMMQTEPSTIESSRDLIAFVGARLKSYYMGKDVTTDDGVATKVANVIFDPAQDRLVLQGENNMSKIIPAAEAPVYKMTIEALDKMKEVDNSLARRPTPRGLTPEGITDKNLGVTHHGMFAGPGFSVDETRNYYHQFAGQPGAVTDARGKEVDISKEFPKNQVMFAQDKGSEWLNSKQMRFIQGVLRKYMPGAKMIVDTSYAGHPAGPAGAPGYMAYMGDGHYLVRLRPDAAGMSDFNRETIFHEIGHAVAWHNFNDASFAQKMAIYAAYRHSLKDDTDSGLMDVAKNVMSWSQMEALTAIKNEQAVGNHLRGWWDLDEFMAEQFAKTIMTEHSTGLNRFFDNVAEKLMGLLTDMDRAGMGLDLKPHEVMADWLDTLHSRPPTAMDMLANSVLKASLQQMKILGAKPDPADTVIDTLAKGPPPDAVNARLAIAQNNGVITPKVKAQADKFSRFTKWMWNSMQQAILNPHIEPLQRLSNFFQQFHADRMGTAIMADGILKAHRKLGTIIGGKLDQLLFQLDRQPYRKGNESSRWPTQDEMKDIVRKIGITSEEWQMMQPVYKRYQAAFGMVIDRVEKAAMDRAQTISDPASKAAKIDQISHEMSALRNKPYFPHNRYGDYAVLIKDAKGKNLHFEMFHTQRQATNAAKYLIEKYKRDSPGADYTLSKMPEEARQWFGLPPSLLEKIHELPGITPDQHQWIDNFRFEMSPENSFSKHFMSRSGIAGYDLNAQRSFANYMSSASGHLARLKYQPLIDKALKDLSASIDTLDPHDLKARATRQDMATWMKHEAEYILHPPNEHAAVRSFAFQWWLGFNPSTAFVHLMQMPMFTAPYMSKIYGAGSVMRMLGVASELRGLYKDPTKFGPEFEKDFQRAMHDGFMSENRGTDMASWANDNLMSRGLPGTNIQRHIMDVLNKTGMFMRGIERFNRLTTFRAAWKEAMADPNNKHVQQLIASNIDIYRQLLGEGRSPESAAAYLAARDAVQQTHFSYTQVARPKWQRGIMSPIMTFMMYKQQALWFFMHNPAGLRAFAMTAAVSGLTGLPGEQDISDIIKQISEWVGTRFDPNEFMQKTAAELTDHPETIMHGLGASGFGMPAFFGSLGIPFPLGDVSRRLGYGDLVPGIAEFTRDQQESFMERFGNTVANTLGAGLEVPIAFSNAMSNIGGPLGLVKLLENPSWEKFRGLEPVMPSIMRNIDQATRYITQGGDVSPQGALRTPIDINDAHGQGEVIARLLGFAPEDVARTGRYEDFVKQQENYWKVRKVQIAQDFVQARMMKDDQLRAQTADAIKRFNADVPDPKMRINGKALVEALKQRIRRNMQQPLGVSPGMMKSTLPAFPEFQQQLGRTDSPLSRLSPPAG